MGLGPLEDAIQTIAGLVENSRARCVIADEGSPDESSILGTRDGYLNLSLCLLCFIADSEAGRSDIDEGHSWDDRIKDVLYQLPTSSAWIVGTYLFASRREYMNRLSRMIDPQLKYPLLNHPSFAEQEGGKAAGPTDFT